MFILITCEGAYATHHIFGRLWCLPSSRSPLQCGKVSLYTSAGVFIESQCITQGNNWYFIFHVADGSYKIQAEGMCPCGGTIPDDIIRYSNVVSITVSGSDVERNLYGDYYPSVDLCDCW
jgi:hypothetical protein